VVCGFEVKTRSEIITIRYQEPYYGGKDQCCGSGMFIPDPGSDFFSIPDPGSTSKNLRILTQKMVSKLYKI
jgi:hypothetical protein